MAHRVFIVTYTNNKGQRALAYLEPTDPTKDNDSQGYMVSLLAPYVNKTTPASVEFYPDEATARWVYANYMSQGYVDETRGTPDAGDPTT